MDILYSSSDSYAFLTGISILSLLENNKDAEVINIYIMDNKISDENKNKLRETVCLFGRNINFVPMPDIKKLTGHDIQTGRWNISTFGRLFMASVLPETVHMVLNIDCDTIVLGSLQDIFDTDMTDKVYAGVSECMNWRYRCNIGCKKEDFYFNAGVVYLNLDEVRKGGYEKKFIDNIIEYGNSLAYLDQDVLNGVVEQQKKQLLPLKYDVLSIYYYTTYDELIEIRRSKDFYNRDEYNQAKNTPSIVHFTTCFLDGLRPWIEGNRHPYRQKFLEYKSLSLWKEEKFWADNRSVKDKMMQKMLCGLPRPIMCWVASILHGVIYPKRNGTKMRKMESINEKRGINSCS